MKEIIKVVFYCLINFQNDLKNHEQSILLCFYDILSL